jgi:tRNA threonylcarbamoyladenosine biosynthesis protein TsaB
VIVLGFDTSTPATAAALRLADGSTMQARDDPPAGAHPGHATRLLEMAHELLAGAGIVWSAVDRIAVGVGPGTFTGLRVGVATARGLAQSLSAEVVGVSSTRALAAVALGTEPAHAAVLAVIDARRGEVFAAAYEIQGAGGRGSPGGRGDGGPRVPATSVPLSLHELAAPAPLPPHELADVLARVEEARAARLHWLAVGDGALRYREQLELAGIPTPPASSPLHLVSAAAVCELGAREAVVSLHSMLPDYRRRPDAELALASADGGPLR